MSKPRLAIGLFGTPCGGTTFVCDVFNAAGIKLGHERIRDTMAPDGQVCGWWWLPEEVRDAQDAKRPLASEYDLTWRGAVVRAPLDVARTLPALLENKTFPWTTGEPVVDALRFWVEAHSTIAEEVIGTTDLHHTLLIRLGQWLDFDLGVCSKVLGLTLDPRAATPRGKEDRLERWSWARWADEDPEYAIRGASICDALRMAP